MGCGTAIHYLLTPHHLTYCPVPSQGSEPPSKPPGCFSWGSYTTCPGRRAMERQKITRIERHTSPSHPMLLWGHESTKQDQQMSDGLNTSLLSDGFISAAPGAWHSTPDAQDIRWHLVAGEGTSGALAMPHPGQSQSQQHGWHWEGTFQICAASPFHPHRGKTLRASSPGRHLAQSFPVLSIPVQNSTFHSRYHPRKATKKLAGSPGLVLPPSCSRFMWLQRLSHFQRHTNPVNGCLTAHCVCSDTAPLPRENNSERVWMCVYTKD